MKFLPKIFFAALAIACIALFLTKCEKQADESVTSSVPNSNTEGSTSSVSDRSPITSCIECDLEWRFLCDETRCDGGDFFKTVVTLNGNIFREDGGSSTCCSNYSSFHQWLGAPATSEWLDMNPGILKSSVYPAMSPSLCTTGGATLLVEGLIDNVGTRMPGTLKIQFRKKGDTSGSTITQHNVPINPDLVPCNTGGGTPLPIPVTIENNCRVTSQYMVTPETTSPFPVVCPNGEGGDH